MFARIHEEIQMQRYALYSLSSQQSKGYRRIKHGIVKRSSSGHRDYGRSTGFQTQHSLWANRCAKRQDTVIRDHQDLVSPGPSRRWSLLIWIHLWWSIPIWSAAIRSWVGWYRLPIHVVSRLMLVVRHVVRNGRGVVGKQEAEVGTLYHL